MSTKLDLQSVCPALADLVARELIHQSTDVRVLAAHLASGRRTVYCGFDPTADSLHLGNLLQLVALSRFERAGHRPIVLVGGATGLIGDPSGKTGERQLVSPETVAARASRFRAQMERVINADDAIYVDNLEWLGSLNAVDFLRDFGKHVPVNTMLAKESIRSRLASGLSFTEFSYMLLQSIDFLELRRRYGCTLQVGGADQWGNITAGIELIRRVDRVAAFGLTLPLLNDEDGRKLGKTEAGAIWLDPSLTPPFVIFQYLLNTPDAEVVKLLKAFTFLLVTEIDGLQAELKERPEARTAQRALAREVTRLIHGAEGLAQAELITEVFFGSGDLDVLSEAEWAQLVLGTPSVAISRERLSAMTLADVLVACGLATSLTQALELCGQGAIRVFEERVTDPLDGRLKEKLRFDRFLLIRRGGRTHRLVSVEN